VERLFQAFDELDDLVAMLRQRWLRHEALQRAAEPPTDAI
jgi:hypothetical protein